MALTLIEQKISYISHFIIAQFNKHFNIIQNKNGYYTKNRKKKQNFMVIVLISEVLSLTRTFICAD